MSRPDPFLVPPTDADLDAAAGRIAPHAVRTPVVRSDALDALAGARLWFKCENLQRGGAFKFRGACNAVMSLDDAEAARGVVTQSSGNHGIAVATAARLRGIPATVVVPGNAPRIKREQIAAAGATIVDSGYVQAERDAVFAAERARTGASPIHPFNDARVIAGQCTATAELLAERPGLDVVITPVSGGGLLSGAALAARRHARAHGRAIDVVGAEPEGARDAFDSLAGGVRITGRTPHTLCDGLRAELGPMTFALLREHGVRIALADDPAIIAAMRLCWDHLKLVIEPSCAVPLAIVLAAAREGRADYAGRAVGIVLSGGNVDLDRLPWQA